jgi:hypothetical protein
MFIFLFYFRFYIGTCLVAQNWFNSIHFTKLKRRRERRLQLEWEQEIGLLEGMKTKKRKIIEEE